MLPLDVGAAATVFGSFMSKEHEIFASLIHMFSVYNFPFSPLFLCQENDMKHQST